MKLKKLLSLMLAMVLALGCSAAAFAALPAKSEAEKVFAGSGLVIYDTKTVAVALYGTEMLPHKNPRQLGFYVPEFHFFSSLGGDAVKLGTISAEAYDKIVRAYTKTTASQGILEAPTEDGDWTNWFCDLFNAYRGLDVAARAEVQAQQQAAQLAQKRAELELQRREVFRLVNIERAKAGLCEVVWDDDFAACAQIRAEEMTIKWGHERPYPPEDTSIDWPANVNGIGIYNAPSVADEQGVPHTWIMENGGSGYETAARAVNGWMNSPGHRANILRESHVRCGVGVYYNPNPPQGGTSIGWALWFDSYEE